MLGVAQEVEQDQQPHGAPREELDALGRFRVWGLGFGVQAEAKAKGLARERFARARGNGERGVAREGEGITSVPVVFSSICVAFSSASLQHSYY